MAHFAAMDCASLLNLHGLSDRIIQLPGTMPDHLPVVAVCRRSTSAAESAATALVYTHQMPYNTTGLVWSGELAFGSCASSWYIATPTTRVIMHQALF